MSLDIKIDSLHEKVDSLTDKVTTNTISIARMETKQSFTMEDSKKVMDNMGLLHKELKSTREDFIKFKTRVITTTSVISSLVAIAFSLIGMQVIPVLVVGLIL